MILAILLAATQPVAPPTTPPPTAAPAPVPLTPEARRFNACVALIDEDADKGIEDANRWRIGGGG